MPVAESETTLSKQRAKALQCAQQGNWADALRIWNEIRTRFPNVPDGYVGAGIALREARRLDEAENLLAEAAQRFADNVPIALERARLANARRDWPEAARRWQAVKPHFADNPSAYVGAGTALRLAGWFDEAESLLAEAAERLPENVPIALERARLANVRRDWPEAARRWSAITKRWPTELEGYLGAITTLNKAGRSNEVAALLPSARAALTQAKQAGIENAHLRRLELAITPGDPR
jgi:tetratricopeptide (TPR) repeat protein